MFARVGIAVCVLVGIVLSLSGCGRKATIIRVGPLFKQKKFQEAIDILTPHLKSDPLDAEAYYARGVAYHSLYRLDDALADFKQAVQLDPDHRKAQSLLAKCYLDLEKYEEAKTEYTAVIDRRQDDPTAYLGRAKSYNALAEYDLALADLERALQLGTKNPYAHFLLARILSSCPVDALRNGPRAVEEAQIAVEMTTADNEQQWKSLCCLAAAHAECGDFKKAIEFLEMGLKLAPDGSEKKEAEELADDFRNGKPYRTKPAKTQSADDPPIEQNEPVEATE